MLPPEAPSKVGYAKVAQLMAEYEEFAILRRFKALNYQNLLYLQAEIIHLEESLDKITSRDTEDEPDRWYYARDWWTLAHAKGRTGKAQWKKICRIRRTLKVYNETLMGQAHLSKLESPNAQDLDFLRSWFERPSMGCFPLRGIDQDAWDRKYEGDLIAIKPRLTTDALSRWVTNTLFPVFHRVIGTRIKQANSPELGDGIYTYDESHLLSVVSIIGTVVAAVMPLLSSVVLYMVPTNEQRLGITVLFSALFALALVLMTNARRIEIFAATSAFAAVNVVFLTNTVGASQCS